VVIEELSLAIQPGEWFVLMGPNGCGKSTLLDCVVGRLTPVQGEVRIAGYSLKEDPVGAKRRLGYACAPESLPGLLTARQCLEVHAGVKGLACIDEELLRLAEEVRFLPYLESFVDTLSLGTRQKLSVLLSLLGDPQLIVLDESFNGLDPSSALVVKRHLRSRLEQRAAAVLMATHALDIVEHYADRAGFLTDGRLQREWQKQELQGMRLSAEGFDKALAESMLQSGGT
jgi:ABC-2 type transport system ATP-binding protein